MIKLLSVNLNYYNTRYGDWIDRKQRLIQKIRECDPDILTLQAVKHDPEQFGEQDQVSQLSKSMPEYPYHQFFPVTSEATDGSGFISKIQASETDTKYLSFIPGLGDPNHRIVVRSTIDRFDAQLHVFNSHLSWVREQTEVNIPEVIAYTHKVQGYKNISGRFQYSSR
jgi:endonuclease/exonuclease/phosphatase family metal-dependent hydrolase